ncbi:exported hypothetical protein [Paraburkholderia piptadeniae]|uniref:Transmembrane protein n=1 Tax=Paraburkholderia piptadeniae TaxID=1701573 RepID=A0A1N7S2I6_9BURK|nr:exported hypothetical protein [Paraburkholderia piptadeniae]
MKRLPIYFVCSLVVCWATVAVAWAIGLIISCAFVEGCYGKFGIVDLMRLISLKSVLVRGTLLSVVFMVFAWAKFRRS